MKRAIDLAISVVLLLVLIVWTVLCDLAKDQL
jgi:hypothetical protein